VKEEYTEWSALFPGQEDGKYYWYNPFDYLLYDLTSFHSPQYPSSAQYASSSSSSGFSTFSSPASSYVPVPDTWASANTSYDQPSQIASQHTTPYHTSHALPSHQDTLMPNPPYYTQPQPSFEYEVLSGAVYTKSSTPPESAEQFSWNAQTYTSGPLPLFPNTPYMSGQTLSPLSNTVPLNTNFLQSYDTAQALMDIPMEDSTPTVPTSSNSLGLDYGLPSHNNRLHRPHDNCLGSDHNSPDHSTEASSYHPAALVPTFQCQIDNCSASIPVDKVLIWDHLCTSHSYSQLRVTRSVECRWNGCICSKKTKKSNCKGHAAGHGWHGEDIVGHIWDSHMDFQAICNKCGKAGWEHKFSYDRHVAQCAGRKSARCRQCLQAFASVVALAGHVELGLCPQQGRSSPRT
jgi:hypothetical protein